MRVKLPDDHSLRWIFSASSEVKSLNNSKVKESLLSISISELQIPIIFSH